MIAEFKKIGDWEKAINLTRGLDKHIHQGAVQGQYKVAKRLEKIVKNHLLNQDLRWKKLSPSYAAKKRDNVNKILVERWKYYEAIKTLKKGAQVLVGVEKARYYVNKGGNRIALYKVASFHESGLNNVFGKYKLPKRPLWNPSFKELSNLGINELIVKEMRQIFKQKGWGRIDIRNLRKYKAPV